MEAGHNCTSLSIRCFEVGCRTLYLRISRHEAISCRSHIGPCWRLYSGTLEMFLDVLDAENEAEEVGNAGEDPSGEI